MAEALDVKSLFKPKKKGLKAFKVGGAEETSDKAEMDAPVSIDLLVEPDLAPVASLKLQEAPEFKATSDEALKKAPSAGWTSQAAVEEPKPVEPTPAAVDSTKPAKYVPFSGRAASTTTKPKVSELPTLAEATRVSKPSPTPTAFKPAAPAVSAEETARKEKEKEDRKKKLQEEIMRTNSGPSVTDDIADDCKIQAASLSEIAAKYVNRPKIGRSF